MQITFTCRNEFRFATLTNSPLTTLTAQLLYAKLTEYYEATLSIDSFKKYKSVVETYTWAIKQLSVNVSDLILIAAHGWDIAGALQAGMQPDFIEREGQSLDPLYHNLPFVIKNLIEVKYSIIAHHK